MGSHFPHPAWFKVIPFSDCQGCNQYYDDSAMFMSMLFVSSNTLILGGRYVSDYFIISYIEHYIILLYTNLKKILHFFHDCARNTKCNVFNYSIFIYD